MSYKSCDNCRDRTCAARMAIEFPNDRRACEDWDEILCRFCGGVLSEIRDNGMRHCYSCHFEFEEKQ